MIDCVDGLVISWSIGTRPDADLVNTMLDAAIERVATSDDRSVIHSDRGAHYRSQWVIITLKTAVTRPPEAREAG